MKLFITVFCCLMTLVVSKRSGYGILLVRFGGSQEQPFCISFHDGDVKLPESFSEKDFNPLVDTSPDTLCDVPADISNKSGSVVMVPGFNCSITEKAIVAEELDAAGLVVIFEDDLVYGNETYNISVALMSREGYVFFRELNNQHFSEEVTAVLFRPEVPHLDPVMFFIVSLAVFIVAVGGYWSGLTAFKKYKKESRGRSNSGGEENTQAENGEEDQTNEDGDHEAFLEISKNVVCFWAVMLITVLLLLFFFFNIFVYVMILMFCIGTWSSLHVCLHPFVIQVFKCKSSTPVIPLLKTRYTYVSLTLTAFCLVPVLSWFVLRKEDFAWMLQDSLTAVLCIFMLKVLHLPNLKMCVLLLGLLFVYNLSLVFLTPLLIKDHESVMLKAVTGGEKIPVLFMFPILGSSYYKHCSGFSFLGCGDIVIPGFLVGYCHGFDMKKRSVKVYFICSIAAYLLGIFLTFNGLVIMRTAQPALVYIAPCMLTTVVLIGWFRGELRTLWTGPSIETTTPETPAVNTNINT